MVKTLWPPHAAPRNRACMQRHRFLRAFVFVFVAAALNAQPAATRPIELEDLFRLKRVSDPQIAPDGKRVAYVVAEVLKDENRTNSDIWLIASEGGEPRKLTNS